MHPFIHKKEAKNISNILKTSSKRFTRPEIEKRWVVVGVDLAT